MLWPNRTVNCMYNWVHILFEPLIMCIIKILAQFSTMQRLLRCKNLCVFAKWHNPEKEFQVQYIYEQSWASDNSAATTWPCFKATKLLVIALLLYSLWQLHLDTKTLTFFTFFRVPEALLRCRVVIVAKLNNRNVPSSVYEPSNSAMGLL